MPFADEKEAGLGMAKVGRLVRYALTDPLGHSFGSALPRTMGMNELDSTHGRGIPLIGFYIRGMSDPRINEAGYALEKCDIEIDNEMCYFEAENGLLLPKMIKISLGGWVADNYEPDDILSRDLTGRQLLPPKF